VPGSRNSEKHGERRYATFASLAKRFVANIRFQFDDATMLPLNWAKHQIVQFSSSWPYDCVELTIHFLVLGSRNSGGIVRIESAHSGHAGGG
jgi:hypothetical protein